MSEDVMSVNQTEGICSKSCIVRYAFAFHIAFMIIILIGTFLLGNAAEHLQKKIDRRNAEEIYSDNYEEVNSFIEKERKAFRNKSSDDPELGDKLIDAFTLGLYSYADPRSYDDEDEYVRKVIYLKYFSIMETSPGEIIGKGILDEKSRDEIIDEIIETERDNHYLGKRDKDEIPLTSDNPLKNVYDVGIILFLLMFPGFLVTLIIALKLKRKRFVNVQGGKVFLRANESVELSDVKSADTGALHTVTVITNDRSYKQRFIRNHREIVQFINERCNNAAQ